MTRREKNDQRTRTPDRPPAPTPVRCEPSPQESRPGGRRGPECPEGYPEKQPPDEPAERRGGAGQSRSPNSSK